VDAKITWSFASQGEEISVLCPVTESGKTVTYVTCLLFFKLCKILKKHKYELFKNMYCLICVALYSYVIGWCWHYTDYS
jgi:hypothetical protein